jgi:hypothetical protein
VPFLQVLWNPRRFGEAELERLRDALIDEVGMALTDADPSHLVNSRMVDARLIPVGPLDRIRGDLFVTLLARHEPARAAAADRIVDRIARCASDVVGPGDVVVELSLTHHYSSLDYSALE